MSEVKNLYILAKVNPINFSELGKIDFTDTIELNNKRYPAFTTERQSSVIDYFLKKGYCYKCYFDENKYTIIFSYFHKSLYAYNTAFPETLAKLISIAWNDLTIQDKKNIRNILQYNKYKGV